MSMTEQVLTQQISALMLREPKQTFKMITVYTRHYCAVTRKNLFTTLFIFPFQSTDKRTTYLQTI